MGQRGGRRVGAGRKAGTRTRLEQTAIDVAAQVLSDASICARTESEQSQKDNPRRR